MNILQPIESNYAMIDQVFSTFDEAKKGYLSRTELKYACVALLGHRLSRHELHALAPEKIDQIQLNLQWFRTYMVQLLASVTLLDDYRQAFQSFGQDGVVSLQDWSQLFEQCAPRIPSSVVAATFQALSSNKEDVLSWKEFSASM